MTAPMQPRRVRSRPGGAVPILSQQPPGPPPGTMMPGTPPPPPPVGAGDGQSVQAGAMGDYRNALLRRMQMQGPGGTPMQPGSPPVASPMVPTGGMPGMGAPQPPQQMPGGPDGVAGLIQNLLRTRNSRRVLGGASGPLGQ